MKTKLYNWNVNDALKTPEDRAAYIEVAMGDMTFSNVEDAISYLHANV